MTSREVLARRSWQVFEPVHAVTYFSHEPLVALKEAGYKGFWMGYFAGRAAPLGAVGPEVVHAVFYNFSWERVSGAVPDAWSFAKPAAALDARLAGSVAALRRILGAQADSDEVTRAADLAMRAVTAAPLPGRPLAAAVRGLPVPEEPLARLWHAATFFREHRGDAHNALLLAAGIEGRESHVLQALAVGVPTVVYELARDFTAEEWDAVTGRLADRGLVADGAVTDAGRALKADLEARTDALAAPAYADLSPEEHDELNHLVLPIARAVVATGEVPNPPPTGLDLADLGGDWNS